MKHYQQTLKEYGNLFASNDKKDEDAIDTSIDIFNGIEENATSTQPITTNEKKSRNLYNQLDDNSKMIYDKLYENKENLKTGTYKIEFGNAFQSLLSKSDGEKQLKKEYQSAIYTLYFTFANLVVFSILINMFVAFIKNISGFSYIRASIAD